MKIIYLLTSLILIGCQPQFFFYNSQAGIPHKTKSVISDMRLITIDNQKFNLGVIAAADNEPGNNNKIYYLLIAPGYTMQPSELDELNVTQGGIIYPEKAQELTAGLEHIINTWNNSYGEMDGIFYNFYSAPEQEVQQISENVDQWNPSFELNFYNTNDEREATIILGKGALKKLYYFGSLTTIKNFQTLLNTALKELYKMGYKAHS